MESVKENIISLTPDNFQAEVLECGRPVLVTFDWQQPWKFFLRLFCCAAEKFWQLWNIVVKRKSFANYCILY